MTDLGIVIVNYNTRDDLSHCLASLRTSAQRYSRRTLVVDNASSDGSAALARASFADVAETIETGVNGGYAFANNIGMRALGLAQGRPLAELPRYVLLLNPDTVLPPEALDAVVAYMDAQHDIGVLGPKLVRPDGSSTWPVGAVFPRRQCPSTGCRGCPSSSRAAAPLGAIISPISTPTSRPRSTAWWAPLC